MFRLALKSLIFIPLILLASAARSQSLVATASPEAAQPGGIAVITVSSPAADAIQKMAVRLRNESFAGYRLGSVWKAVVAVRALTKPGVFPAAVTVTGRDGSETGTAVNVRVLPRAFPTQKIRVAPSKSGLMSRDILAREWEILVAAMKESRPEPLWGGKFTLPVASRVTSDYGKKRYLNGRLWGQHSGIDLTGSAGVPVKAPAPGRVAYAGKLWMRGNTMIIDHGFGVFSLFNHLSAFDAAMGESVRAGQPVARVGATGLVTGPHLHWEVRIGTVPVNPWPLVRNGLPL
ncbi:MAG: M23 family metallopeptidase [Armatimonadetes bacterium]|nr:M23 family metallopeptidase [Armatimonadota bacterium]